MATSNPEQLPLFKQGSLDAVWTVEPWVTRLLKDGGGKIFYDQKDAVTTVLVTCNKALKKHKDIIKKFVQAHIELTEWIKKNPQEAQKLANAELEALTGRKLSDEIIKDAWNRIIFTSEINKKSLQQFMDYAHTCGFIRRKMDISKIFLDNL